MLQLREEMKQNPFPEKHTIVHEVGHLLTVWHTGPKYSASIAFWVWDEREAARTDYKSGGISATQRVMIAVAGAVAQYEAGLVGYLDAQSDPVDLFVPASAKIADEIRGDFETTTTFAGLIRPPVPHPAAVRIAIAQARTIFCKYGGGLMIAAVSERIRLWLEDGNRQRWREALAGDGASVFEEVTFYKELEEIGRTHPNLRPCAKALQRQIEKSRKARGVPTIEPRSKSSAS